MLYNFLDVPAQTWLQSNQHLLLIIIAAVSIAALVGIFIYRRKKGK